MVIMDAAMPVLNGIEATRQIITAVPQSKITALSMHNDKRYILEMLKAGASGYMLKVFRLSWKWTFRLFELRGYGEPCYLPLG
jgi:DNA-binding NarL/FixJ family response regulator